jgi:Soluble lytic murein transglycosylase and related regulatory proteins (some contain LysM/invasin domains)
MKATSALRTSVIVTAILVTALPNFASVAAASEKSDETKTPRIVNGVDIDAEPKSIVDMIRISRAKRELAKGEAERNEAPAARAEAASEKAAAKPAAKKTAARKKAPAAQGEARKSAPDAGQRETAANVAAATSPSRAAGRSKYIAAIRRHAAEKGVPADLAEAVVMVESNFNPRARSRGGAMGLMQILPSTARGLGFKGSTAGLLDPETNLHWGMTYLATAYKLAGGDTCGAILRYNAGHYARHMSKGTRAYCAKVNRYVAAL